MQVPPSEMTNKKLSVCSFKLICSLFLVILATVWRVMLYNGFMSAWQSGSGRAPSCFTVHEFDEPGFHTTGVDTVNQTFYLLVVGKLIAISIVGDRC
jgi:hypothetical protein